MFMGSVNENLPIEPKSPTTSVSVQLEIVFYFAYSSVSLARLQGLDSYRAEQMVAATQSIDWRLSAEYCHAAGGRFSGSKPSE